MSLKRICALGCRGAAADAFLALQLPTCEGIPIDLLYRASHLHVNHQMPYVLSRLAASAALSSLLGEAVPFTGGREDARKYGAFLSLSHEDLVGAAIAWRDGALDAFSIDVVDIQQMERVTRRHPQFCARWLPCCDPSALRDDEVRKFRYHFQGEVNPTAIVLAQHWGLRECCVKLVGIEGRSFPSECIRAPNALLPRHFDARVVNGGRDALKAVGLSSELAVSCWSESVQLPSGISKPYIVVVAACRRASCVC
ncbi:hypothetical protein ERJ75_001818700 [Trypanosoma vivax]|nr:hypothetical protein ERJ75_001818700 [Trypanosoma vivax]